MRLKTWKSVSLLVILTNLLVLFYMLYRLDPKCKCSNDSVGSDGNPYSYVRDVFNSKNAKKQKYVDMNLDFANVSLSTLITSIEERVTFVIREFEHFENNIPNSLNSILTIFPNVTVLIVCDSKPYPPLNLKMFSEKQLLNVKIISLKLDPIQSAVASQPENYVKTKYLLLWPDSVRLSSALQVSRMIGAIEDKTAKLVAAKVAGTLTRCLDVDIDLLKWTITYEHPKKRDNYCNYLEGDHVVLLPLDVLQSLSHPWARPFPSSVFLQTAIRGLKVRIVENSLFVSAEKLFTDSHQRWKKDSLSEVRRNQFFQQIGVKKVVEENGEASWYGCTKESQRCFGTIANDMPEYLFENRWTPPCCLEHLRETTRHVVRILEKCGMRYWLEGGSLLGAARYEDIIPWDYDVDIGIYRDDIEKCEWLKNARKQSIVDTKGFVWEKAKEGDFFRVQFSNTNHLHVDLFPFYSRDGIMTKDTWFMNHKQDAEFPEHYLMPFITIKFIGIYVSAPNNIRDFLELKFGKKVIEKPEYPAPHILKFPFSR